MFLSFTNPPANIAIVLKDSKQKLRILKARENETTKLINTEDLLKQNLEFSRLVIS